MTEGSKGAVAEGLLLEDAYTRGWRSPKRKQQQHTNMQAWILASPGKFTCRSEADSEVRKLAVIYFKIVTCLNHMYAIVSHSSSTRSLS